MSRNRPQAFIPNREHNDQVASCRGCTEKLPSFLAGHVFCGDDRVRPVNRFLHFRGVHTMPVNMADIVRIPIEAFNAVQQSLSIYSFCIYSKARPSVAKEFTNKLGKLVSIIQRLARNDDAPEIDLFEAVKLVEQLSLAELDDDLAARR